MKIINIDFNGHHYQIENNVLRLFDGTNLLFEIKDCPFMSDNFDKEKHEYLIRHILELIPNGSGKYLSHKNLYPYKEYTIIHI
jgi:hypothetical protein